MRISNCFNCTLDFLFGISEKNKNENLKSTYDMSKFLERYDKVLKENKTTHWKFCNTCELNESSIRRWKKGAIPSMNSLILIAQNLSTSIDYLVGRSDK